MSDILIPFTPNGTSKKLVPFALVKAGLSLTLNLSAVTSAQASYATAASGSEVLSGDFDEVHLRADTANSFSISGVSFKVGSVRHTVKANGDVQRDLNPASGIGTKVGTMTPGNGEVVLTAWPNNASSLVSEFAGAGVAPINGPDTPFATYAVTFRTGVAPLRSGGFSVLGTMQDGTTFNLTANADGVINGSRVKGRVNYTTGVVRLVGVSPSGAGGQEAIDLSFLGIPGLTTGYIDLIRQETLRYNAVGYTYLPLDADLLGINPERLPSDGRAPIFKAGGVVVIGNTQETDPQTVANGDVIDVGRTRLSRVRVIGHDNGVINIGYTVDREAGTVTFTDVSGYSQPVTVQHRIEDTSGLRDAQIDGTLTLLRPLTHVYPAEGTVVSSAFVAGDLKSRVSLIFDQASWDQTTFSDALVGSAAPGTYNDAANPIAVTNAGAIPERWAARFVTTSTVSIVGEHVGVLGTFPINAEIAPANPNSEEPYFRMAAAGWGGGWAVGNIVRFNTVGALVPFWLARTTKQGPASGEDYSFAMLVRGDVDNPL